MRAVIFEGIGKPLVLTQMADPTPGPGQVVIRVGRCGICGSDLHMAQGHGFAFETGAIPGHEVAGEIVALGPEAEGVRLGDHVAILPFLSCGRCAACLAGDPGGCESSRIMGSQGVQGGYAEYVLADARWCVQLPRSLSHADGALVEPLAVSLHAPRMSGVKPGDRVLVIGAGAIGVAAAYWARRAGAGRVVVSATSRRREAVARAVGAHDFVTAAAGQRPGAAEREALGAPADLVFECAGAPGCLDLAVAAARRRGMIVAPGFCWTPDSFSPVFASIKEVTIKFSNVYETREFEIAIGALDSGAVEPRAMISETVTLQETPGMFESLLHGHPACKVQIAP